MNLEREPQRLVADFPMVGEGAAEFPFAATLITAVVKTVPVLPRGPRFLLVAGPDDLGIGADQGVGAPALLLHAIAALQQLVIPPAVGEDKSGALDGRGRHGGLNRKCAVET